jgi:hypothetical protein
MAKNVEYIGWSAWVVGPFEGSYSPFCMDQGNLAALKLRTKAVDGSSGLHETV